MMVLRRALAALLVVIITMAIVWLLGIQRTPRGEEPPAAISSPRVPASPLVSQIPANFRVYRNTQLGVAFRYPAEWGAVQETTLTGDGGYLNRSELTPENIELIFTRPPCADGQFCNILVRFRRYDTKKPTYEECYEGSCWTVDLREERAEVEQRATRSLSGRKALMFEDYFAPGGNVNRIYRLFTPSHRIEINGAHGVLDLQDTAILDRVRYQERHPPFIHAMADANPRNPAFAAFYDAFEDFVSTVEITTPAPQG